MSSSMTDLPTITIVTPSFNQREFLAVAIRSIVEQRYPGLEYFVLDGGSTDGSVDVLTKHSSTISRWTSGKDDGQSDAIVRGFGWGEGEILGWINSDDALFPGALHRVGVFFRNNPEVDILLGGLAYANSAGAILKCYYYSRPSMFLIRNGVIAFGQQGMFFRRRWYQSVNGLRTDFHYLMDTEFLLRSVCQGAQVGTLRRLLGIFRWHEQMKSINRSGRKQVETDMVKKEFFLNVDRTRLGRKCYQLRQAVNGNYAAAAAATLLYSGRTIESFWEQYRRSTLTGEGNFCD